MRIVMMACTERGFERMRLASERLGEELPGAQIVTCGRCAFVPGFEDGPKLSEATGEWFDRADALVYFTAAGIAVRCIAPFVRDKFRDPAVLAADENGAFVISLLSGHAGGANRLCRLLAEALGAQPVITTATDGRGLFAVDVYAAENGLKISDRDAAKRISARLLAGETVKIFIESTREGKESLTDFESCGKSRKSAGEEADGQREPGLCSPQERGWHRPDFGSCGKSGESAGEEADRQSAPQLRRPRGNGRRFPDPGIYGEGVESAAEEAGGQSAPQPCRPRERVRHFPDPGIYGEGAEMTDEREAADVILSPHRLPGDREDALYLIPPAFVLGIGCRKGTKKETIRSVVLSLLDSTGVFWQALAGIASIDLKRNEEGLLEFAREAELPLAFFSAAQLGAVRGSFSSSAFVKRVTGVDNVCERSAVCLAGEGGTLFAPGIKGDGVTCALAALRC